MATLLLTRRRGSQSEVFSSNPKASNRRDSYMSCDGFSFSTHQPGVPSPTPAINHIGTIVPICHIRHGRPASEFAVVLEAFEHTFPSLPAVTHC